MTKKNLELKNKFTKMSTENLIKSIGKGGMKVREAHWAAIILSHRIG